MLQSRRRLESLDMDTIHCDNCSAELPLEKTDVIKLQPEGAHYQESKICCPVCNNVLLLEVTMAGDEATVDLAQAIWG
jgi:hypothetical protein